MKEKVYNFEIDLDWDLIEILSTLDRFDASWASIEKKEGDRLNQLKEIATIKSVGASTRIEGSKMSDKEIEILLNNIEIDRLEDRDSQEAFGYFKVLDLLTDSYLEIDITESNIKNLHNQLLRYSDKDVWHRGDYKQHVNAVEATFPDGTKQIIFRTTEPGLPTEEAMQEVVTWFQKENKVHPLIRTAAFVYDFLSIHPFQDGNGRLSRLLTTLLLMKSGYKWIQYVSFEHEIEQHKKDYYKNLRYCQSQRPEENITEWVNFFLESLQNIQTKLSEKLEVSGIEKSLSAKARTIYLYIIEHPGCRSGEIAKKFEMPSPTVKKILASLLKTGLIQKHSQGAGTNYTAN